MSPARRTFVAVALVAALAACQDDADDAPPVGAVRSVEFDVAAAQTAPAPAAPSLAQRHADFRLALQDARAALQARWDGCRDDEACRLHALSDYDRATAAAGRTYGLDAGDVIDLQPPPTASAAATPLVQLGGSRG